MIKKTIIALLLFFSLPGIVNAWSEDYYPNRFAGMYYNQPGNNWSGVVNVATPTDNEYATINVQFGNPAPQVWRNSYGFSFPELIGNTASKVEVYVRARRRYNVSPGESLEAYIVDPDGDIVGALNATDGTFVHNINDTNWKEYRFEWKDEAPPYDRVSQYLDYLDDYNFTVVFGAYKNGTSGSTNFMDISQVWIRFETEETDISKYLPVDISKVDLAVEQFKDTFQSRAPFAYIYPVFDLDFSPVASSSPDLYFPVPYPDEWGGTVNYALVFPQAIYDFLSPLRWITGVALIGLFILYLSRLGERTI